MFAVAIISDASALNARLGEGNDMFHARRIELTACLLDARFIRRVKRCTVLFSGVRLTYIRIPCVNYFLLVQDFPHMWRGPSRPGI